MAQIIQPSVIPTLTVGGRVFTDLTNLIILTGTLAGAANGYTTMRRINGTAGYQVTTGKTLTIYAMKALLQVAGNCNPAYADADVGNATNTALTNPIYFTSVLGAGVTNGNSPLGSWQDTQIQFAIPAGKYMCIVNQAGATNALYMAFGYES